MTFTIPPEVLVFALGWVFGVASLAGVAAVAARSSKRRSSDQIDRVVQNQRDLVRRYKESK